MNHNPNDKVLFILRQNSWLEWITPFLESQKFNSEILCFENEIPSAADILSLANTKGINAIAFISHYSTVESDVMLTKDLAELGFSSVLCQPDGVARLSYDKRAMASVAELIPDLSVIPELTLKQALHSLENSIDRNVVIKAVKGTEGRHFKTFSDSKMFMQMLSESDNQVLPDQYLFQSFIHGDEYSVVALANGWDVQVYEPVFKGATSLKGIHPARRVRFTPPWNRDALLLERLRNVSRMYCRAVDARGLVELEFIVRGDEIFFLEINPRLAATMRMVALASPNNLFEELGLLALTGKFDGAEDIRTKRSVGEFPLNPDLSTQRRAWLKSEPDVSVSTRATVTSSTHECLTARISALREALERE